MSGRPFAVLVVLLAPVPHKHALYALLFWGCWVQYVRVDVATRLDKQAEGTHLVTSARRYSKILFVTRDQSDSFPCRTYGFVSACARFDGQYPHALRGDVSRRRHDERPAYLWIHALGVYCTAEVYDDERVISNNC